MKQQKKNQKQKIVPRPEKTDATLTNTIVYVQYSSEGFEWGKNPSRLGPLSTPIDTVSNTPVTYEFVSTGSASIWYKLPPTAPNGTQLPSSSGPTDVVATNSRSPIAFAQSSGGTYSTGYVKVSDDDDGDDAP